MSRGAHGLYRFHYLRDGALRSQTLSAADPQQAERWARGMCERQRWQFVGRERASPQFALEGSIGRR